MVWDRKWAWWPGSNGYWWQVLVAVAVRTSSVVAVTGNGGETQIVEGCHPAIVVVGMIFGDHGCRVVRRVLRTSGRATVLIDWMGSPAAGLERIGRTDDVDRI